MTGCAGVAAVCLQADQARWIRSEGTLRAQVEGLQEQLSAQEQQRNELQQQLKHAQQSEMDANRWCKSTMGCECWDKAVMRMP